MGERMTRYLLMWTLCLAVSQRRPPQGLIRHTDSGSQYCAHEFRALVAQFGTLASISRRGNCYDNAPIESFWGTLKNELIYHRRYATQEQARREILSTSTCSTIASGGNGSPAGLPVAGSIQAAIHSAKDCLTPCWHTRVPTDLRALNGLVRAIPLGPVRRLVFLRRSPRPREVNNVIRLLMFTPQPTAVVDRG